MKVLYEGPDTTLTVTKREKLLQAMVTALQMALCAFMAWQLSMDHAPDESSRYVVAKWIMEHNALPVGPEEELVSPLWGISYAFLPYLPSMLAAIPMKLMSLFSTGFHELLFAARLISVLAVGGISFLSFRIGRLVFRQRETVWLFACLVTFWPQLMFIGSYHNNDSVSVFSAFLILYFWLSGRKSRWKVGRCIGLGVAMSICLLTYYYAYGWVLCSVVFCVADCLSDSELKRKGSFILRRAAIVAAVVLVCAGWFYVRNYVNYDGDMLGMTASGQFKQEYSLTHPDLHWANPPKMQGMTLTDMLLRTHWIPSTLASYIGVFSYMNMVLPLWQYGVYVLLIGCSFPAAALQWIRSRGRADRVLILTLLVAALCPVCVSIYGSFNFDYQGQGRYILSSLPCVTLCMACGCRQLAEGLTKRLPKQWNRRLAAGLAAFMTLLNLYIYKTGMYDRMVAPEKEAAAQTALTQTD